MGIGEWSLIGICILGIISLPVIANLLLNRLYVVNVATIERRKSSCQKS